MKSITIKDLDSDLIQVIQRLARSEGESPGKVINKLLRKALNIDEQEKPKRDVSKFYGIWTKEEAKEFDEAVRIFEQIDEEMWS